MMKKKVKLQRRRLKKKIEEEDSEKEEYVTNGVIGLEAPRMLFPKVMTEEEKRIWSTVFWPSSLPDVLQRGIKMAKEKTFLTAQAF